MKFVCKKLQLQKTKKTQDRWAFGSFPTWFLWGRKNRSIQLTNPKNKNFLDDYYYTYLPSRLMSLFLSLIRTRDTGDEHVPCVLYILEQYRSKIYQFTKSQPIFSFRVTLDYTNQWQQREDSVTNAKSGCLEKEK